MESSLSHNIMKNTFQVKGFTSMSHDNVVQKLIPMPQAMKIPDAQAAVEKKWNKLETIPAWDLGKSKTKRRLFWKHKETKKKVFFATLMDICHLNNAELEPKLQ